MAMQASSRDLMEQALDVAEERSRRYIRDLAQRSVYPSESALAALAQFHELFPESASDPSEVVRVLDDLGSPATVATTGGRYFGFVIGGVVPAALAASRLVNTWDQNAVFRVMAPVVAELEEVVLGWICEIFGLPASCRWLRYLRDSRQFHCALRRQARAAGQNGMECRRGWDVWSATHRRHCWRRGSRLCAESPKPCGFRTEQSHPGPGGQSGTHERGKAPKAQTQFAGLYSGGQCQHRLVRSGKGNLRLGAPE